MWIKTDNDALSEKYLKEFGERVSFSENNKAQVSKEVGEYLISEFEAFEES